MLRRFLDENTYAVGVFVVFMVTMLFIACCWLVGFIVAGAINAALLAYS